MTYGLKVPKRDDVTFCGDGISVESNGEAQYSLWLETMVLAEQQLSVEQHRLILAIVERELARQI